jgi:hypothetical protein
MTTISAGNQLSDPTLQPYAPTSTPDDATTTGKFPSTSPPPPNLLHGSSFSRASRRSLAVIALEKTSNAIANLASLGATPSASLRSSASSGSLSKHSHKYSQLANITSSPFDGSVSNERSPQSEEPSQTGEAPSKPVLKRRNTVQLVPRPGATSPNPFSEAAVIARAANKMHQTSSRLLRMTEDERPFTKVCAVKKGKKGRLYKENEEERNERTG